MDEGIKKVNDKISDRMKHIMKIWNTNVNIYEKNLQQVNKIVIKMLNKHENPSDTSKSKRQKQKTKRMYDEHSEHGCTKAQ